MAQVVSAGPLLAEMRPVEYPPDNLQALRLALGRGVAFDGVIAPVMAAQVQGALWAEAEVVYPQRAVMQQRVGFALNDPRHAQVDCQSGPQRHLRNHVVCRHGQADGVIGVHSQSFQRFCGQAQVFAGHRRKQAILQFEKGHFYLPGTVCRQWAGRVGRRLAWRAVALDRVWVFWPFARAQPTPMHTEQIGQFVQAGQGHAAFEPVVDVLRCDAALGGESGSGQATFVEKGFKAVAGSVHGASVTTGPPQGNEPVVDEACKKSASL